MKKSKFLKRTFTALVALSMFTGSVLQIGADAGEAPPPIGEDEVGFPDPDSFSYDDVEVNFAKALQYSLYFYDANKCGEDIEGGYLEWRGDCHTEDKMIPLVPMGLAGADAKTGTNLSQDFIDKYKDILDPDGDGYIDCEGGMHDAGDHVKFGLPGSYAASTVGWGYYEFRDAYVDTGNQEHVEDILHWFNDFYMKGTYLDENGKVIAFNYQVGEGNNDHNYWNPPELQSSTKLKDFARPAYFATTETPASDMCAGTAASLAINYLNFKDTEPEYAEESLKKALALYDFAVETHADDGISSLGYDGGFYTSSYDWDELAWAAVWLYECTGDYSYIDDIISVDTENPGDMGACKYTGYMKRIIADTGNCWQNIWVHCWDTIWGGVFAKLAPITNISRDWYIFRWNLEYWAGMTPEDAAKADHEVFVTSHKYFGLDDEIWNTKITAEEIKDLPEAQGAWLDKTPAGFAMLNNYGSARYDTAAQLCALVYAKETNDFTFADWSESQMEYIMGKNPMDRCYIVGYADNSATHPHHRAAHGSKTLNMDVPWDQVHVLWGALVGGPDGSDWHRDITKDYIYNEVAVDYNAGFVGACAGLYEYYGREMGNKPEPNFPPKENAQTQYWLKALINQENKERTQFTVLVCNDSSVPPHYVEDISCRYYFNISELIAKGQSIEDVKIEVYYDQEYASTDGKSFAKVSEPIKYDDEGGYYVEIDWTGCSFYGTRELQLGIIVGQDAEYNSNWDPTNDYSREGLEKSDVHADTAFIPMYLGGKLVYGQEPDGTTPTTPVTTTTTKGPSSDIMYGDVNLDKKVTGTDIVVFMQYFLGPVKFSEAALLNADVTLNGKIELTDLATLKQFLAGDAVAGGLKR